MCSGYTNHFTNFAILLGGNEDECDDTFGYTITWLSIAFIIVAISIVLLSVVVIELRTRVRARNFTRSLSRVLATGSRE